MFAVEMNLAWNFTGTEHLTLYYDSVEDWGGWHALSVCFFASRRSDFKTEYVTGFYSSYHEETQKAINRLKGFGSR